MHKIPVSENPSIVNVLKYSAKHQKGISKINNLFIFFVVSPQVDRQVILTDL